jgi:hypothetical protein
MTDEWETRDGRVIPLEEMHTPHIVNAAHRIKDWAKGEEDPQLRRELRSWRGRFRKELRRRQKAWEAKRNARTRD